MAFQYKDTISFLIYTHSSDFLIFRIFSIVVLPTLRNFINSLSGIVRNRFTSIISCPFSYRMIFASLSALFAIVKTLSSFMFDYYCLPSYSFGRCFIFSLHHTRCSTSQKTLLLLLCSSSLSCSHGKHGLF